MSKFLFADTQNVPYVTQIYDKFSNKLPASISSHPGVSRKINVMGPFLTKFLAISPKNKKIDPSLNAYLEILWNFWNICLVDHIRVWAICSHHHGQSCRRGGEIFFCSHPPFKIIFKTNRSLDFWNSQST